MAWYNLFKKENKTMEVVEGYQSFSTPFLPVGKGDLSLPYVNGRYSTNMWVRFGNDNLFPELLNQMYFSSPLHGAICDYKIRPLHIDDKKCKKRLEELGYFME